MFLRSRTSSQTGTYVPAKNVRQQVSVERDHMLFAFKNISLVFHRAQYLNVDLLQPSKSQAHLHPRAFPCAIPWLLPQDTCGSSPGHPRVLSLSFVTFPGRLPLTCNFPLPGSPDSTFPPLFRHGSCYLLNYYLFILFSMILGLNSLHIQKSSLHSFFTFEKELLEESDLRP